jgi:hypothetical protein
VVLGEQGERWGGVSWSGGGRDCWSLTTRGRVVEREKGIDEAETGKGRDVEMGKGIESRPTRSLRATETGRSSGRLPVREFGSFEYFGKKSEPKKLLFARSRKEPGRAVEALVRLSAVEGSATSTTDRVRLRDVEVSGLSTD